MKIAGELVHQGCPLPRAAEEQCCPAPTKHCVHSSLHSQMASEFKKNHFHPFFTSLAMDGSLWCLLSEQGLPTELKVGGLPCTCLAVSPFLQHSETLTAMHKSALG